MRRLSWIITLPITVLAILFALSNSATTQVKMWPLPWVAELPLYLLILGCLLLGFLLGAVVAWISGASRRRRVRSLAATVRAQAEEIGALKAEVAARAGSAAGANPAGIDLPAPRAARVG